MNKLPSFPFYPGDWFDLRVMRMSYGAQGVYIRLLAHMWKDSKDQCSISSNVIEIAHALGLSEEESASHISEIQHKGDPIFRDEDGRYISKRLQKERRQYVAFKRAKSEAGRKGNDVRWGKESRCDKSATVSGVANDRSSPSPSPSPSPSEEGERLPPAEASGPGVVLWGYWKCLRSAAPIGRDKGVRMIQFALKRGAKFAEIESAFTFSERCAGKFIWEVLDDLTPKGQPGQKSMMEILQKFGGGK